MLEFASRLSEYNNTHRDTEMERLEEVLKAFKTIRGNLDVLSRLSISNSQKFEVPENILVDYFDTFNQTTSSDPKLKELIPYLTLSTEKAFDDFAGTGSNEDFNRKILGI